MRCKSRWCSALLHWCSASTLVQCTVTLNWYTGALLVYCTFVLDLATHKIAKCHEVIWIMCSQSTVFKWFHKREAFMRYWTPRHCFLTGNIYSLYKMANVQGAQVFTTRPSDAAIPPPASPKTHLCTLYTVLFITKVCTSILSKLYFIKVLFVNVRSSPILKRHIFHVQRIL